MPRMVSGAERVRRGCKGRAEVGMDKMLVWVGELDGWMDVDDRRRD